MVTRNSKDAWSSEKILTVLAGSMLALYSIKLLHEWVTEAEEDPQDTKEDAGQETLGPNLRHPSFGSRAKASFGFGF